ncbi:Acetyltransferase (GNAT) family protein [Formivibrio citricus]|uniref:Acetyltransferase (GNAT) family protein n=1 Tax=Formivibrio citricus TaxID=83765 RepID=A0A1I5BMZ9_9NEIS|nr:GNAT family N-acetyltransferase [Formivibrio citricus]SFN76125.1 Acetyltransferase (GNAT) family protein [Formivibrio citricus]
MGAGLTLSKRSGQPDDALVASRLVYDSDPPYYDFLFASERAALSALNRLWLEKTGSLSHAGMTVWLETGQLTALASHYPAQQAAVLDETDEALLAADDECLGRSAKLAWLFPHIPAQAWYLRTLAVASRLRGRGAGSLILQDIAGTALRRGATELHTDVDSGNPGAVRFYLRHGFEIVTETRVPMLEPFNLPASYRMVKKLA